MNLEEGKVMKHSSSSISLECGAGVGEYTVNLGSRMSMTNLYRLM